MRNSLVLLAFTLAALPLTGCELYFGGGGDDKPPPCTYNDYGGTGGSPGAPSAEYRDPSNGQCQYFGGYPYPCDGTCGPCPEAGAGGGAVMDGGTASQPDWGMCYSACEGLTENQCEATSGCYAAFMDDPAADGLTTFWGCWQTAPSGPVQGSCAGLDAHECSRHDNCTATYAGNNSLVPAFELCSDEHPTPTACLSDIECGTGERCDTTVCNPPPGCDPNCANCGACPDVCYGQCVPQDPNSCSNVSCNAGYHCEEHCYGDGTTMMSSCEALCVQDLTCASVDCGPGYTCSETCTADANGNTTCHPTCIPNQVDACETLQTESTCISRADCVPVYDGQNCTCYPDHCSCQTLTYERCESLYMPL